jgi:hypothetical protein
MLSVPELKAPDVKLPNISPSQYPYFTLQVKYPESILRNMTYDSIVETFFDRNEFIRKFGRLPNPIKQDQIDKKEYKLKIKENSDNNIMLMIKYLFPTSYPVVNNYFNSYELNNSKFSIRTLFFNPFRSKGIVNKKIPKYIHLKISSGSYTIKKLVWLNDTFNIDDIDHKEKDKKYITNEILDDNNKKSYYVGIKKDNNDIYEIVIDVELFEGQLKPGDEKKIECSYKSDYLGEKLLDFFKPIITENKKKIPKIPLFSITNMISKTRRYISIVADDKIIKKRQQEIEDYNEIQEEYRTKYEKIHDTLLNDFIDQELQKRFKEKIKKYDINKINFFLFLNEKFKPLLKFLFSDKSEYGGIDNPPKDYFDSIAANRVAYKITDIPEEILIFEIQKPNKGREDRLNINKYIEYKMNELSQNKKKMSKEEYDETKLKYDLVKEFVERIKGQKNPFSSAKKGGKKNKRKTITKKNRHYYRNKLTRKIN